MKLLKYLNLAIRIILFILVLVLILDNIQIVTFNFFNVYHKTTPLIVLCLIFLILGFAIGYLISILQILELKSKIKKLTSQLTQK